MYYQNEDNHPFTLWAILNMRPNYEIITRTMASFTGSHFFTHLFGCLLMTINRYMAVCQPDLYNVVWKRKIVNIVLTIEIIISFVAHTPLFLIKFDYQWIDDKWMLSGRTQPIPFNRILSNSVVIIYEVVSITLIVMTMYAISNLRDAKSPRYWKEMVSTFNNSYVC
ncbi:unnamed protein product [Strongylus vulgaris]|uniref:Serpentine receptor class gamma n=1 Tax=Strongylus vulgaris TaxID=40348 RepID=A0A3P7L246_STRVU|nr:unnamed protein product [Strongylus vulgaris]